MSAPLEDVAAIIDDAQGLLAEADRVARACSSGKASLYIQGARGNLRLASEIAFRRSAVRWDLLELGFSLVVDDPLRSIGRRVPLDGVGLMLDQAPDFEQAPTSPNKSLGVDLLGSVRIRELATRPVFAALLVSALSRHEWCSLGTGARWQPDEASAALLVSILGGGRQVSTLSSSATGGLVDRMVADELDGIGWRLLRSPTI